MKKRARKKSRVFGRQDTETASEKCVVTFEDRVIFVHDMETCLNRLDEFSRQILARNVLQEHDQAATARLLGCAERTVRNYVPIAWMC
jgi:DNA-directed RNA polymerase specialized sigma24 family protein